MNKEILKRLEEIERRVTKATPGPWVYGESEREQWVKAGDKLVVYLEYYGKPDPEVYQQTKHDFEFVAHTREDVPWLRQIVRELLAQYAAMRRALERVIRVGVGEMDASFSHMTSEDCSFCEEKDEIAKAALKESDAGRDLLDRLRKLERVAEAARDVVAWWREYAGSVPAIASIYDLEQALTALEETKQ